MAFVETVDELLGAGVVGGGVIDLGSLGDLHEVRLVCYAVRSSSAGVVG